MGQLSSGLDRKEFRNISECIGNFAMSKPGRVANLTHSVLSGHYQWFFGKDVSRVCNIAHVDAKKPLFRNQDDIRDSKVVFQTKLHSVLLQCYLPWLKSKVCRLLSYKKLVDSTLYELN